MTMHIKKDMKRPTAIQSLVITILVMATILGVSDRARAAVIAYDDLEGATLGSLSGQTSGTGFTAGYVLTSGATGIVSNKSLSYTAPSGAFTVDGGTNCIMVGYPDKDPTFTRAIGTQSADVLYLSFLFQTPTADGGGEEDFLTVGFNNSAAQATAGVAHRKNGDNSDHYFACRRIPNYELKTNLGTVTDQTYFVVFRLRKVDASSTFNELTIFVDPDSIFEPVESPLVYTNSTGWAGATHLAVRVAILESGDRYYLDNLCVGESYDDVVFPNGDSPIVKPPTIEPDGGEFEGSVTITLSSETVGASMRYTTDGETPSDTVGSLYEGPFNLTGAATLRAIAYKVEMTNSPVASADFSISYTKIWTGLDGDKNWSTAANWDTAGDPTGYDLIFGTSNRVGVGVVNNIVDADITISSLSYTNTDRETPLVSGEYAHTTEIGTGVTLTIDGSSAPENAVLIGDRTLQQVYRTYVTMTGGGNLVIDAESSNFRAANPSSDHRGEVYLDMAGLNYMHASVSNFYVGFGKRNMIKMDLPSSGNETNRITASVFVVGDSEGDASTEGYAELNLGRHNEINADDIFIGARLDPTDTYQVRKGYVQFQDFVGGSTPTVRIRAKDGISRANLTMAELGGLGSYRLNRATESSADFTGGIVDALFGDVVISKSQAYGYSWAGSVGTLSMGAGTIDVTSITLGRSIYRGEAPAVGNGFLNVTGGVFRAGSINLAYTSGCNVKGVVNVSGSGTVEVSGDITMGTRLSASANATVTISNGTMTVQGNMAPASASTNITSDVLIAGGDLMVTNSTGTAMLKIEHGTLSLIKGSVVIDNLVMSNTVATTSFEPSGTSAGEYAQVEIKGTVELGGSLVVTGSDGYELEPGYVWVVMEGGGTRTGKFESTTMPEGMELRYTASGFRLFIPKATLFSFR